MSGNDIRSGAAVPPGVTLLNMRRSLGDAACFGAMVGCGETYFAAFALAIGLGEATAGAVASVPLLVGGLLQLFSPVAIRWVGGMQRWIVIGATVQAISLLPLALAAWTDRLNSVWLILLVSLYWSGGLATGPAWNTWMEQVVPAAQRIHFFSRRSRLQQFSTFVALLCAGMALHLAGQWNLVLPTFAMLFLAAAILRVFSAGLLHRTVDDPDFPLAESPAERPTAGSVQVTPQAGGLQTHRTATLHARNIIHSASISEDPTDPQHPNGSPAAVVNGSGSSDLVPPGFKLFLIYLIAMQMFVQVSGPYFAPYMLKHLDMGYGTYVGLISLAFVAKIASTMVWGRFAQRFGSTWVLFIGGLGLIPLAFLWCVSNAIWWLSLAQIASGVAWAAYELGLLLMMFEAVPAAKRVRLLTLYNFASSLAIVAGAAIGARWLQLGGFDVETYHGLFTLSSLGRLTCVVLLIPIVFPGFAATWNTVLLPAKRWRVIRRAAS